MCPYCVTLHSIPGLLFSPLGYLGSQSPYRRLSVYVARYLKCQTATLSIPYMTSQNHLFKLQPSSREWSIQGCYTKYTRSTFFFPSLQLTSGSSTMGTGTGSPLRRSWWWGLFLASVPAVSHLLAGTSVCAIPAALCMLNRGVSILPRSLYITMAKCSCLRPSECTIWKYSRHVGSVIMSDDRGSIVANDHDFTISVNLYYLWLYF